jgi:hypothetical protein
VIGNRRKQLLGTTQLVGAESTNEMLNYATLGKVPPSWITLRPGEVWPCSIRHTERCTSGGHKKGAKNCNCREEMETGEIRKDAPFSVESTTALNNQDCKREEARLRTSLESERKAYFAKKRQADERHAQHAEWEAKRYKEAFEGLHGEKGVPKPWHFSVLRQYPKMVRSKDGLETITLEMREFLESAERTAFGRWFKNVFDKVFLEKEADYTRSIKNFSVYGVIERQERGVKRREIVYDDGDTEFPPNTRKVSICEARALAQEGVSVIWRPDGFVGQEEGEFALVYRADKTIRAGALRSRVTEEHLDLSEERARRRLDLNRTIWNSIKGTSVPTDDGTLHQGCAYRDLPRPHVDFDQSISCFPDLHDHLAEQFGAAVHKGRSPFFNLPRTRTQSASSTRYYEQPKDGFAKAFFDAGHTSASMTQKSNGAWYLTKTYREGSKVKREDLYIGKDSKAFITLNRIYNHLREQTQHYGVKEAIKIVERAQREEAKLQVCLKTDDADERKQQALQYCAERGAEVFAKRLLVRCLNPKCREVFESGVCPNCGRSQSRPMWEEWMQWRTNRYALLLAVGYRPKWNVISSTILPTSDVTERGGWSTIFSGNTDDVMDKRSRLVSEEAADFAQRATYTVVPDHGEDSYDDQDHNTALLESQDAVTFSTDETNDENEIAEIQELHTVVELPREEGNITEDVVSIVEQLEENTIEEPEEEK